MEALVFRLVHKPLTDIVQAGLLDRSLVRNGDILELSDRFMDAVAQGMVETKAGIQPVVQLVQCHMKNLNDKCSLDRMHEQKKEIKRLVQQKEDGEIPTQPPGSPRGS